MKVLIIIFTIVLSSSYISWAQEKSEFEQLISKIQNSTYSDSNVVKDYMITAMNIARSGNNLTQIGKVYQAYGNYQFFTGNQKRALSYYDTTIVYAKEANDSTLIISTLIRKNFYNFNLNPKQAKETFHRYLNVSKRRGDHENAAISLNGIALCFELDNKPNQALKYYLEAYDIAVETDNTFLQGMLLSNIGLIKYKNKQYDQALNDFMKSKKLSEKIGSIRLNFYLQNNLGLVYESLGMLEESIAYFKNSMKRANELGFPYTKGVTHLNLSEAYYKSNDPNLAFMHADSAYMLFKKYNQVQDISKTFLIKAKSFLIKKKFDDALMAVDSSMFYSKMNNSIDDVLNGYKIKSKIYKELGQYEKGLDNYMTYANLRDSLEVLTNQKQFSELQVIYETEKREAELNEERTRIAILKKDNRIYQSRVTIITIIVIVVLLIAAVLIYFRYMQIRRKRQIVFSHQLIKNIDDERSRISKDLHDDIGQSLSVAKSKINLFNRGKLDDVDDMEESLGQIIQQVRTLSHRLHPFFLEKIGLNRSLVSLLDRLEKDTNLITSHDLSADIDHLNEEIQKQLYRISQECINNTLKHAEAKSLRITITKEGSYYTYIYRDSGKGFDAVSKSGFGISAMKERVNKIGGRFSIQSQPGKGVKIVIKFQNKEA
ncbi:hypothetical protein CW751_01395 [Brumimicrobium salinarum]|uniref:histidine kinase n=1 Tax=Brumimicrobium salinarum TaxID=2058658 RepID=A0A2I0R6M4_9FLAO|nr:sensor histidine kinase [Brumimicrobium salinarum]PKR82020.1 hypothetical protein CW751_01395 [Brumimicrobium salinarum]